MLNSDHNLFADLFFCLVSFTCTASWLRSSERNTHPTLTGGSPSTRTVVPTMGCMATALQLAVMWLLVVVAHSFISMFI